MPRDARKSQHGGSRKWFPGGSPRSRWLSTSCCCWRLPTSRTCGSVSGVPAWSRSFLLDHWQVLGLVTDSVGRERDVLSRPRRVTDHGLRGQIGQFRRRRPGLAARSRPGWCPFEHAPLPRRTGSGPPSRECHRSPGSRAYGCSAIPRLPVRPPSLDRVSDSEQGQAALCRSGVPPYFESSGRRRERSRPREWCMG
jgi:hypothetical protein